MGRPKANINWDTVDKYLQAGADGTTIAASIGVQEDTLYRACETTHNVTFAAYKQQKRAVGLDNLRVKQYQVAMSGEKSMLIWLGKQFLGQSDKADINHSGSVVTEIEIHVVDPK